MYYLCDDIYLSSQFTRFTYIIYIILLNNYDYEESKESTLLQGYN